MRKAITLLLGLICLGIGGLIAAFAALSGIAVLISSLLILFIGANHALNIIVWGVTCVVSICIATGMFELGRLVLDLGEYKIQGLPSARPITWIPLSMKWITSSTWRLGAAVAIMLFIVGAAWYEATIQIAR